MEMILTLFFFKKDPNSIYLAINNAHFSIPKKNKIAHYLLLFQSMFYFSSLVIINLSLLRLNK